MNKNLTEIILVVDRSGSMASCQLEAENGINNFIKEQTEGVGEALLTLVQFDDKYDVVFDRVPVAKCGHYKLEPRSMTALNDAVGKTINESGAKLAAMKEEDRPGLVIFAIITDGGENASHEFTKSQVREMVEHQEKVYNWQFTFLGSNQDAFKEAANIGINVASNYKDANVLHMYKGLSAKSNRMRGKVFECGNIEIYDNLFTQQEQEIIDANTSKVI